MSVYLRSTGIVGTGSFLPETIVTNADLERIVDTSDEWIRTRSGIVERRKADPDMATSDMGLIAARRALDNAGVRPAELDLIIVGTASPDMPFPATACIIQEKLGAPQAAAFDLQAACASFVYGLMVGWQFIATGAYKRVLVIGADTLTRITNYEDRTTCVLFGDGAGAVVLAPVAEGFGLLSFDLGADGTGGDILKMPGGGSRFPASVETVNQRMHYIQMAGNEVFKYGVRAMVDSSLKAMAKSNFKMDDIDLVIPHQANLRIIDAVGKRLGVPSEKLFVNIHKYGNMSSACVPVCLDEVAREGRINKGNQLLVVGFGGGFTWGAATVRWAGTGPDVIKD